MDTIRLVGLSSLRYFGINDGLELKVLVKVISELIIAVRLSLDKMSKLETKWCWRDLFYLSDHSKSYAYTIFGFWKNKTN